MMNRRDVLKRLSTVPVGLAVGGAGVAAQGVAAQGAARPVGAPALSGDADATAALGPEIFRTIGVEPVINCRGTFTIIGGSLERPAVRAAMEAASQNFVQYDELAAGIGQRLSELTGAEWGMVSAGCAAAIKHATAACVARGNPEKLIQIPDLSGFDKTEVIIPRSSRNPYDHAVRNIGVEVITVDSPAELENALSARTAMIYLLAGREGLNVETVTKTLAARRERLGRAPAKSEAIPILVDAAAEDLTIPNAHLQAGATLVCYSGGKALRGPQCAGLLLGRKDLVRSAWQASAPHHGPGRDNKVGREEMMGMLAAVEAWVQIDHEAEWEQWLSWLDHIGTRVSKLEGVTTSLEEPPLGSGPDRYNVPISNHSPVLHINWDPEELHVTGEEVAETLGRTKPRIVVGSDYDEKSETTSINITAWMMQPGEDEVVADRIRELLSQKRSPKPTDMAAPSASLTGRWSVNVEFFSSESQHTLFIEQQDENWIEGAYQGDLYTRDVGGTIEGDQVKFVSNVRRPGDHLTYIFAGTLSEDGDALSGEVYLGEYLTAAFTAKRHAYSGEREPVHVPEGPPLAT